MLSEENLNDVDYQVKTSELVKEAVFLRQYGTKNSKRSEPKEEPKEEPEK